MTRTQLNVNKKLSNCNIGFPNEKTRLINNDADLLSVQSDRGRVIPTDSKSDFTQNSSNSRNSSYESFRISHLIFAIIFGCIVVIAIVLMIIVHMKVWQQRSSEKIRETCREKENWRN